MVSFLRRARNLALDVPETKCPLALERPRCQADHGVPVHQAILISLSLSLLLTHTLSLTIDEAGKSSMIPSASRTGWTSIQQFPLPPVFFTLLPFCWAKPTLKAGIACSGDTHWQLGISPYLPFRLRAWLERSPSWSTTSVPCRCATIFVWTPKKRTDLDRRVCGYSSLLFPNFPSSSIHFSLSFTRSRSSFCTGTITLPFSCIAGIPMSQK